MLIWKAWKAHGFNLPKVGGDVSNAMSLLNEPQRDSSSLEVASESFKVQIFWEDHKNLKKISHFVSKKVEVLLKFCGLLTISELYN
jgi:hypothetical protein